MRKIGSDHVLMTIPKETFKRDEWPFEWMRAANIVTSRTGEFSFEQVRNYLTKDVVVVEVQIRRAFMPVEHNKPLERWPDVAELTLDS